MYLYSASSRSTSNALPLPIRWHLSPQPALQAGTSKHCNTTDTGWCITQYACLLPQLSPGTHSSLTMDGQLMLSRPGCWFCTEVVHLSTQATLNRQPSQAAPPSPPPQVFRPSGGLSPAVPPMSPPMALRNLSTPPRLRIPMPMRCAMYRSLHWRLIQRWRIDRSIAQIGQYRMTLTLATEYIVVFHRFCIVN